MFKKNYRCLYYTGTVLALFIIQQLASKIGGLVAKLFSYQRIDPHNLFAFIFIHHIVILIIALLIIYFTKELFDISYGFKLGNIEVGIKHVRIFSIIILIYVVINHLIGYHFGFIKPISFSLNMKNILGTLSFQLFLSGPAEELLFRAIPISLLLVFKKNEIIKWGISIETVIAALLFSVAHIQ